MGIFKLFRRKNHDTGPIVLGLNDALVEMLGALTGFTFALRDSSVVASAAVIMGVAAALSMAASKYLESMESDDGRPVHSAFLTGSAYFLAVVLLTVPYLLLTNVVDAWRVSIVVAVIIVVAYNLYAARATNSPFKTRFLRMLLVSSSVTVVSYFLGLLVNQQLLS